MVICSILPSIEDDDEFQSPSPPNSNGRITVTVAAAAPQESLTLALPIQHNHHQKTPGSGGGREDCWSEEATAVLIDAWGERYLQLSRGNLKQTHWKDVADVVNSREDYTKTPRTDIQCKNRIDTVKKKYKTEKAKITAGGGPSKWRFYDKMDELIGPTAKINSVTPQVDANSMYQRVPMGIPVGVRSASNVPQQQLQQRPNLRMSKRMQPESDEESEPENSADSSDGLPPESYKRPRFQKEPVMMSNAAAMRHGTMNRKSGGGSGIGNKESNSGDSMRELTQAIAKFGEAYEQAETAKLQQLVDMEKQRMKFAKELELQRMQFFMKMQLELSQLNHRRPENKSNHHGINNNNDVNNNNNSDSSS